ncbi:serine hydrolase domain-containing protein [Brachybacterium epidermidis]|uniref:serine hydrolase domain-containing protein n=1 Tax=Brachybacterium epidermidis TaxID=2781983 RepID=UPI00398ECE56
MQHTAPGPAAPAPAVPQQAIDEIAALYEKTITDHQIAGVTWAIVGGHGHDEAVLAHGAAGHRELEDGEPTPGSTPMGRGSISRIASLTKSFTAATILALRDEGRLRLDDPVEQHLPEAADAFDSPADARPVTLRDLLSMNSGLVTDNPWGDRQESMTREAFAQLLQGGLGRSNTPGTRYEYSNTGFAMLGRVIDEITGRDYTVEIHERFLDPLGMVDTAFETSGLDLARLATGHRLNERSDATRFEAVPFDLPGVYGAMAGLYSTVDDIATWVRFLAAADAPDAAGRSQDLLSTGSRREMQQIHRHHVLPPLPAGTDGTSPGFDRIRGYGYGLAVDVLPDLGELVSHSGGYPGYGAFMQWHRDSGVGVVALANSKYAPLGVLSVQALQILAKHEPRLLADRIPTPAPRTLQAAGAALDWLRGAGDALADTWFADNMDLDISRAERRRRLEQALEQAGLELGALGSLTPEGAVPLSQTHLRWTVPGAQQEEESSEPTQAPRRPGAPGDQAKHESADSARDGGDGAKDLRIDLQMDPRREALVQGLDTVAVPRA